MKVKMMDVSDDAAKTRHVRRETVGRTTSFVGGEMNRASSFDSRKVEANRLRVAF
jgi:hypothetical protein